MSKLIGTSWKIVYKNWRGVTMPRYVTVKDFKVDQTKYHPEKQLLMEVYDLDRKADRLYATKDIVNWVHQIETDIEPLKSDSNIDKTPTNLGVGC